MLSYAIYVVEDVQRSIAVYIRTLYTIVLKGALENCKMYYK